MSEYRIDIKGDATQFAATTQRVLGKLNGMTSSVMASAARMFLPFATAGGAAMFTRSTLAWADQLNNLSQRTTLNVETLQELDHTAKLTSTSLAAFTDSVRYLVRAQISAQAGQTRFSDAFERLGISAAELTQLNPEQLFRRVALALKGGEINSQRMADIISLMGERGTQLIPAMTTGLDTFAESARNAGIVVEESLVKQLAAANAEWDILMAKSKAFAIPLVRWGLMGAESAWATLKHAGRLALPSTDPEASKAQLEEDLLSMLQKYNWDGVNDSAGTVNTPMPVEVVADSSPTGAAQAERAVRELQIAQDSMARTGLFTTTHQALTTAQRQLNTSLQQLAVLRQTQSSIDTLNRSLTDLL
jgi:hypothetical protein